MASTLLSLYREIGRSNRDRGSLAYLRVRQTLARAIETGLFSAGQAMPGERDLAAQLAVSRVTVRKAIAGLVEDGQLTQRRGAGTFVAGRIVKSFSRMSSFTDDLRARGLKPRSEFYERSVGEVTPEEAMALNLSPGARVVRLHRLRFGGELPLALERTAVPQDLLGDPALVTDSLYEALDAFGLRPRRALQRLRAIAFDAEPARRLGLAVGSPGLFIERRSYLDDGRAIEFTCSYYRGDAYDFVAELHSE